MVEDKIYNNHHSGKKLLKSETVLDSMSRFAIGTRTSLFSSTKWEHVTPVTVHVSICSNASYRFNSVAIFLISEEMLCQYGFVFCLKLQLTLTEQIIQPAHTGCQILRYVHGKHHGTKQEFSLRSRQVKLLRSTL